MGKALCTFSGRTGDILWSLATVQELYKRRMQKLVDDPGSTIPLSDVVLDFACMPQYKSLLPLIQAQPYIKDAFVLEDWILEGSPFGDQPWLPPTIPANGYAEVRHLTYRFHPQGETLADAIARQQMMKLPDVCAPFIHVDEEDKELTKRFWEVIPANSNKVVGYAFNWMAAEQKATFLRELSAKLGEGILWVNLTQFDWLLAAFIMKYCKFFLGCRSANYVLAHGLNKKVLCYEPAPERRPTTFGFRQGTEVMPDVNDVDAFVRTAEAWLQ